MFGELDSTIGQPTQLILMSLIDGNVRLHTGHFFSLSTKTFSFVVLVRSCEHTITLVFFREMPAASVDSLKMLQPYLVRQQ